MVMAPLKAKALIVLLLLLAAAPTLVVSAEKVPPSSALYHFNLILHADATDGGDTTTYSDRAKNQGGKYLMVVDMGPPGNKFTAVAGTGGDVTWTRRKEQCDHARRWCPSDRPQAQDCVFRKQYGRSIATGFMANETLFFFPSSSSKGGESAAVSVPVDLGCSQKCQDDKGDVDCNRVIPTAADGVIGLDRGPKSLVTKLGVTRFSYCLGSRTSPLWLGGAKLSFAGAAADVQSTRLVPRAVEGRPGVVWANKYYVELEGISVITAPAAASASASASAGKVVSIPKEAFSHRSLGGRKGVMFVDSGLTYSKLETAAYNVVKNLLAQQEQLKTKRLPGKNICFKIDHANTAANNIFINLHLAKDPDAGKMSPGGGATATMSLGWSNYMKPGAEPGSSCLAIKDSGQGISALGNFQQHNIHMVYDLVDKKLFFVPVQDCSASNIKLID